MKYQISFTSGVNNTFLFLVQHSGIVLIVLVLYLCTLSDINNALPIIFVRHLIHENMSSCLTSALSPRELNTQVQSTQQHKAQSFVNFSSQMHKRDKHTTTLQRCSRAKRKLNVYINLCRIATGAKCYLDGIPIRLN